MSAKEIRIGIVGANADHSWAKVSHIPAIQALQGVRLAAVATRNEESARRAAEVFGADRWFSDPYSMIRDEQIDIVTVCVNVPAHRQLVLAALDAGKAVYSEAPLGSSVAEAEEMMRAIKPGQHTAIGMQGRLNPSVRRAAQLLSSGKIGRLLNAKIVATSAGFGPEMSDTHDFFNQAASGANLLTINGGHTLDLIETLLGPIVEVDARTATLWPSPRLTESGKTSTREVPDHADIIGMTQSGTQFNFNLSAGVPIENSLSVFEIRGTDGWLRLRSGHPYGFQAGDLELTSSADFNAPDQPLVTGGFMGSAINIGEVYGEFVEDIRSGSFNVPGFGHALHNSRLIETVARAAESGQRQTIQSSVHDA